MIAGERVRLAEDTTGDDGDLALARVWVEDCKPGYDAALDQAARGDGAQLAQVLARCGVSWHDDPEELLGVLPRVHDHRRELAAALRFYRDDTKTYSSTNIPFREVADIVMYRDLARLVGDDAGAQRWQQIFARFDEVLSDRRRLIAFMLWSR